MKLNHIATIAIACGTIFASANAGAVVLEGWERPVSKAEMKIVQSAGAYSNAKDAVLTMTKQDGHKTATGFVLLIDGQSYTFSVIRATRDGCGTTDYVADLKTPAAHPGNMLIAMPRIQSTLLVQDHSTRFCEDLRLFRWQASLQTQFEGRAISTSELQLKGNPQPLFTIQALQDKTLGTEALLQPRCLGGATSEEVSCDDGMHAMDAGFGVSIATTGGCARISVATMTEITIAGAQQLGTAVVHRSVDNGDRRVYSGSDFNLSIDLANRRSDGKFPAQLESTANGRKIARSLECEIIR